jgi:hypothetical protein
MKRWLFQSIAEKQEAEKARKQKALDREIERECKYFEKLVPDVLAEMGIDHWLPKADRPTLLENKLLGMSGRQKVKIIQTRYTEHAIYLWVDPRYLPYHADITRLYTEEVLETLSYACERTVTWRGNPGNGAWYCIWRNGAINAIPTHFKFSDAVESIPEDAPPLSYVVGVTENSLLKKTDLAVLPHLIVAGSTFTGKSVHLNSILCQLISRNTPATLQLMMIDLKGGSEFQHYEGLPHLVSGSIVKTPDDVPGALEKFMQIIQERQDKITQRGLKTLEAWNTKFKTEPIPYLLLVVDELAMMRFQEDKKLVRQSNNALNAILATARSAGGHAILCTQSPRSDVIDPLIKANMGGRICFAVPSFNDSIVVLDNGIASKIEREVPGRAIWSYGPHFTEIQSPYISDHQIAQVVKAAQHIEVVTAPTGKPSLEDVLRVAIEYYAGQLDPNKIHHQMRDRLSRTEIRAMIRGMNGHPYIIDGTEYRFEKKAGGMHGGRRLVAVTPPDAEPIRREIGTLPTIGRKIPHEFLKAPAAAGSAELTRRD